jgi:hypothetical protein
VVQEESEAAGEVEAAGEPPPRRHLEPRPAGAGRLLQRRHGAPERRGVGRDAVADGAELLHGRRDGARRAGVEAGAAAAVPPAGPSGGEWRGGEGEAREGEVGGGEDGEEGEERRRARPGQGVVGGGVSHHQSKSTRPQHGSRIVFDEGRDGERKDLGWA